MSPQAIISTVRREVPLLSADEPVGEAVAKIAEADVPALPVVGADGRLCGIFGEREFIAAVFPAYLNELGYAGFVPKSLEAQLEKRASCAQDPVSRYMNTDHIDVGEDHSDTQVAETFLHHRVLIVPIVEDRRVTGIITREDFFRALAARFNELT